MRWLGLGLCDLERCSMEAFPWEVHGVEDFLNECNMSGVYVSHLFVAHNPKEATSLTSAFLVTSMHS